MTLCRRLAAGARQLKRSGPQPLRYEANNLRVIFGWTLGHHHDLPRAPGNPDQCRHTAEILLDVEGQAWAMFRACESFHATHLRPVTPQEAHDMPLCIMLRRILT